MLGKMLSERTCITISYHFGYFLNGIPVLHNKGGSLAHPYTPNHINSSQFATLLYFSIKGRLTHIQLLRQHFYIKVLIIIRKTKRFAIPERAVYFLKTKRTAGVLPHPKNFRPAYAGIHIMQERSPDTIRTPFFSFCRFAPAFRASRYAASLNALYATTLCALTSLPRKARREPTLVLAPDASLFATAYDTPPYALALLHPR